MQRLNTLLTLLVISTPLPLVAQRSTAPDQELMNYRLSMEKLRKLPEVQRALNAAHAKNPQVFDMSDRERQAMMKTHGGSLTVSRKAALLDKRPEIRRAFTSAGWTAREWMLTSEAMGNAYMAIEAKKGTITAPPPTTDAQRANVALLEKNQAEFQKITEELDQLTDELINE